jgi:SpoIID/LytB domain protein
MVVWPSPGKVEVVLDQLPMQRYLDGIGEVPSSWHTEALRAQAIAARTFAAYRLAHPRSSRYDLVASTADQNYIGDDKASGAGGDRWVAAVASTNDQILTSGGKPIQAFYSSSNGGFSERCDYVFVADLPYFAANPDPYDAAGGANRNHTWSRQYSGEELGAWLRAAGRPDVGAVTGLEITGGTGASGRVDKATVLVRGASGGWYTITGNQLRSAINARSGSARQLLSTKFTITANA